MRTFELRQNATDYWRTGPFLLLPERHLPCPSRRIPAEMTTPSSLGLNDNHWLATRLITLSTYVEHPASGLHGIAHLPCDSFFF